MNNTGSYSNLIEKIKKYNPNADIEKLDKILEDNQIRTLSCQDLSKI